MSNDLSVCVNIVHSIKAHPNSVAALAHSVIEFLGDDSNGDVVLQQCEGSDESGWASTSLIVMYPARSMLLID